MQTVAEEKLIPERDLHEDDEDAIEQEKDFINTHDDDDHDDDEEDDGGGDEDGEEEDDDDDDDDDDDEEFSFMSQFGGELTETSLISADDAFVNGQIKPVLPLFNQQLVLSDHHESLSLHEHDFPKNPPPVRKIFVQTKESEDYHDKNGRELHPATSLSESDVISGPYCDLSSRKVVEVTPPSSSTSDTCKKSNSTGFSKIWRFKDFVGRSNSDGRDAFVFLSEAHAPAKLKGIDEERAVVDKSIGKVKKVNKRGDGKKKTSSYSAHEAYLRSKVKGDNNKRSSYLPYKPELMGFFTNVNGGLTKNVHPF